MTRPTLSTGSIDLSTGKQTASSRPVVQAADSNHCHIAVLADFSGRGHRGLDDLSTLAQRKIIEVDRDNLDEVFARLAVTFDSPLAESVIAFRELDDLHPDYIYDKVPVFERFKALRRRLKSSATFAEAAAEIQGWADGEKSGAEPVSGQDLETRAGQVTKDDQASLLDQLLEAPVDRQTRAEFDVKLLVREIMLPYLTPRPDPRQKELLAAVDEAASQLMRNLLHNSDFQKTEASWRGLYFLCKRLETDARLKLFIIDISQQELFDDAAQHEAGGEGALRKLLTDNSALPGAKPFAMIMADYQFSDIPDHGAVLAYLAAVGAQTGTAVLTGGSERIAGCNSLADRPDSDDWDYEPACDFCERWQQLRASADSRFLSVFTPRFLLRLPYGKKWSRTERFDFEELPGQNRHNYYLWANGAWLATLLLAQSFTDFGWNFRPGKYQQVERLPVHVFPDADGESQVTPCAEINMTDRTAGRLTNAGFSVVRSVYKKDSVLIPSFHSAHHSGALLNGPWRC